MADEPDESLASSDLPEILRKIRARTPARLLVGRAGASYRTGTQLDLREAHAADFGTAFVNQWNLFEVSTQATRKDEYLLRPDLGRRFSHESRVKLLEHCSTGNHLQIAVGDGLSVTAVSRQVPPLLPLLCESAKAKGWSVGHTFVIRHCRVGILNEIGELLTPEVAILLIGERPGLATAESLSAYMACRPQSTHTDANRNLISNIHARGVSTDDAVVRILNLAGRMMKLRASGYSLREELPVLGSSESFI